MVRINLKHLIEFYDGRDTNYSRHVSSITGILGEDLLAALIKHYFEANNQKCEILEEKPVAGKKGGKWLDRWIRVNENEQTVYYQTEIKNWSSHSLGGRPILLTATKQEIHEHSAWRFGTQWLNGTLKNEIVGKVLGKMKPPTGFIQGSAIRSLLCYWFPISDPSISEGSNLYLNPFFKVDCGFGKDTKDLYYFSGSLYLRGLIANGGNDTTIEIDAPNIKRRLELLNRLLH